MRLTLPGSCAGAVIGPAVTEQPSKMMNSRRFMSFFPRAEDHADLGVYRRFRKHSAARQYEALTSE